MIEIAHKGEFHIEFHFQFLQHGKTELADIFGPFVDISYIVGEINDKVKFFLGGQLTLIHLWVELFPTAIIFEALKNSECDYLLEYFL